MAPVLAILGVMVCLAAAWVLIPVAPSQPSAPEKSSAPLLPAMDFSLTEPPRQLPFLKVVPELQIPSLTDVAGEPEPEVVPEDPLPAEADAVPAGPPSPPRIVIIIDDLGASRAYTRDVIALPGPLTLAYLPYPERVGELVEEGRAEGHEIIMHMPMEAMEGEQDTGDYVLRTEMAIEDFSRVLEENLGAFDGYIGINNHMGSRLTQDREAMAHIMASLKDKNLLFVDSRTVGDSVGADEALKAGIPYASRDVFLDHDPSPEGVRAALAEVEDIARRRGLAIAIGHPKPATIEALDEWLPTLKSKGFLLVPVSAVVSRSPPA